MNIWFFSAYDQPRGRSSRTYDFALELINRGHVVTFFTNSYCHWTNKERLKANESFRFEEIDGINVVWLKTIPYVGNGIGRGLNMLSNMCKSYKTAILQKSPPDVVIGPSVPIGTGWVAKNIAKKFRAIFIFEIRDVWPQALVDDGGLSKLSLTYLIFRYLEKILYKKSDGISSTLPLVHNHVERSGGSKDKIKWIPNGVDLNRFKNYNSYDGGNKDSLKVMYVGAFGVAHDVLTIVKCAKIFQEKKRDLNISFVIYGSGPKKKECVDYAKDHGIKNVEFHESVDKSEVPVIQNDADILVASILDSKIYRFGINLNKIYDYLASARPVVFAGKAPNDPIKLSNCGYSINPQSPNELFDCLFNFYNLSPEKRRKMGQNGLKFVDNNFSMSVLGGEMEDFILSCQYNLKR